MKFFFEELKKGHIFCAIDEIIHLLNLDNNYLAYHFCQWAHDKEYKR